MTFLIFYAFAGSDVCVGPDSATALFCLLFFSSFSIINTRGSLRHLSLGLHTPFAGQFCSSSLQGLDHLCFRKRITVNLSYGKNAARSLDFLILFPLPVLCVTTKVPSHNCFKPSLFRLFFPKAM